MEIDNQKIANVERIINNMIHAAACDTISGHRGSAADYRECATDYAIVLQELGIRDYAKEENMVSVQLAIIVKINRKVEDLRKDKHFLQSLLGDYLSE